jgi:hypothetical protein
MISGSRMHLWKAKTPDWPWVARSLVQVPEPFTIEKLGPILDDAGGDRAVTPSWSGDRNDCPA